MVGRRGEEGGGGRKEEEGVVGREVEMEEEEERVGWKGRKGSGDGRRISNN